MITAETLTGQVIAGRYRVEQRLGEGGAGLVYRAQHLTRREPVAIKVLRAEHATHPEMSKRFEREATVAARFDHPNIITIYDSGRLDDGSLYYVMELLEGRSMTHILQGQPLPMQRALSLVRQLLDALGYAHARGVVHRDVKPDNIMLVTRAGVETVKVVDFGLASDEEATEKLTVTGVAFGTPEYLSPEMALGDKVDGRADLYAVGVILYEMMTGRRPFIEDSTSGLMRAHAYTEPPPPRQVAPQANIPEAVEAVILKALAKVPQDRWASAAEMKEALVRAVNAPAGGAKPAAAAATAAAGGQAAGKAPWPWIGVGVALLAGVIALILAFTR